jgi:hypothetical protein
MRVRGRRHDGRIVAGCARSTAAAADATRSRTRARSDSTSTGACAASVAASPVAPVAFVIAPAISLALSAPSVRAPLA